MKKFMPKVVIALATLMIGTYVLQTVQPFAEKSVEAAGAEDNTHLKEGDVFTYGTYKPIGTAESPAANAPLKWRIVYANDKTGEGVAMTEQPIEQASKGWNTNCYYAAGGAGNCTATPWTHDGTATAANKNYSILTTNDGAAATNQLIDGSGVTTGAGTKKAWQNAYFGGSVADWMDRYFVPRFVGSIQGSPFGTYIGYYNGANKDVWNPATNETVLVDWFEGDNRVLANSNGDQKSTKATPRAGDDRDATGMYNPYIYTMPFAYKANGDLPVVDGKPVLDENGFPKNAVIDSATGLPTGEAYGAYNYPSTWISYSTISLGHKIIIQYAISTDLAIAWKPFNDSGRYWLSTMGKIPGFPFHVYNYGDVYDHGNETSAGSGWSQRPALYLKNLPSKFSVSGGLTTPQVVQEDSTNSTAGGKTFDVNFTTTQVGEYTLALEDGAKGADNFEICAVPDTEGTAPTCDTTLKYTPAKAGEIVKNKFYVRPSKPLVGAATDADDGKEGKKYVANVTVTTPGEAGSAAKGTIGGEVRVTEPTLTATSGSIIFDANTKTATINVRAGSTQAAIDSVLDTITLTGGNTSRYTLAFEGTAPNDVTLEANPADNNLTGVASGETYKLKVGAAALTSTDASTTKQIKFTVRAKNIIANSAKVADINYIINVYPEYPTALTSTNAVYNPGNGNYPHFPVDAVEANTLLMTVSPATTPDASVDAIVYKDIKVMQDTVDVTDKFVIVQPTASDKYNLYLKAKTASSLSADLYTVTATATFTDKGAGTGNVTTTKDVSNATPFEVRIGAERPDVSLSIDNNNFIYKDDIYSGTNMIGTVSSTSINNPADYPTTAISKVELVAGIDKNDSFELKNSGKHLYVKANAGLNISNATKKDADGNGVFTLELKITTDDGKVHNKKLDITMKRRDITLQVDNKTITNDNFNASVLTGATKATVSLAGGTLATGETLTNIGEPNLNVTTQSGTVIQLDNTTPQKYGPGDYKIVFVTDNEFTTTGDKHENYNIKFDTSGNSGKLTVTPRGIDTGDVVFNIQGGAVITDLTKYYNKAVEIKPSSTAITKGFTKITDQKDASNKPTGSKASILISNESYTNRTFYLTNDDGTVYSKAITLNGANEFVKLDTKKPTIQMSVTKNTATLALGYLTQSNLSFQYFKTAVDVSATVNENTEAGSNFVSGLNKIDVVSKTFGTDTVVKTDSYTLGSSENLTGTHAFTNFIPTEGTYSIETKVTDKASNVSDTATTSVVIDKNGPDAPIVTAYQVDANTNFNDLDSWKIDDNKYTPGNWAYKKNVVITPSVSNPDDTGIQGFAWRKAGSSGSFVKLETYGPTNNKIPLVQMTEDGEYEIEIAAYWMNGAEMLVGNPTKFKVMMENDDIDFDLKGTAYYDSETDAEYVSGEVTGFNVRLDAELAENINVPVKLQYKIDGGSLIDVGPSNKLEITSSGSHTYDFEIICPANIVATACTTAGTKSYEVKIARAAITAPTVSVSTLDAEGNKGLTYKPNTWTNKDVIFEISGGIDDETLLKYYEYQAVPKGTQPVDGAWISLIEGTTKLKSLRTNISVEHDIELDYFFRVNPGYGEPGNPTNAITVKIDKTSPRLDKITLTPQTSTFAMDLLRAISFNNYGNVGMDFAISTKPDTGSPLSVTYTLKRGESIENNNAKYTSPVSVTNEGGYSVTANIKDEAGNTGVAMSKTFAVDRTAPTYSGLKHDGVYYLPKTIKFEDAISGINAGASTGSTNGSMTFNGESYQSIKLTHDDVTNGDDDTTFAFNVVDYSGNATTVNVAIKKLPTAEDVINDNDPDKQDKWEGIISDIENEIKAYPPTNKPFYDQRVQELKDALASTITPAHSLDPIDDIFTFVDGLVQVKGTVRIDAQFPNTTFTFELLKKKTDGTFTSINKFVGTNENSISTANFNLGTAKGDTAGVYKIVVTDSIHPGFTLTSNEFDVIVEKKAQDTFNDLTHTLPFKASGNVNLSAEVKGGKGALTFGTSDASDVISCDNTGTTCTMKKAGIANFKVTAAGDNNYKSKTITLKVVVKPGTDGTFAFEHITNDPQTYTYGDSDIDLALTPDVVASGRKAASYRSSDPNVVEIVEVDDGTNTGTMKSVGRIVGAGQAKIDAIIEADDKFEETIISANVIVNRAQITVKTDNKTKEIGAVNPAFTISVSTGNLIGSDVIADLGKPIIEVKKGLDPVDEKTGPGFYEIKLLGFENGTKTSSYDILIDPVPGTFEITEKVAASGDFTTNPNRAKDGSWVNKDITISPVNYDEVSLGNNVYKPTEIVSAEGSRNYDIVLKRGNVITSNYSQKLSIDKTAPTLVVSEAPAATGTSLIGYIRTVASGGIYDKNMTITLAGTDVLSGVERYEYSVDELASDGSVITNFIPNTIVTPDPVTGDASFTLTPNKGVHLLVKATAYDKAGNATYKENDITIDTTAPAAPTITAPIVSGVWTANPITNILVEDNKNVPTASGVDRIEVCDLTTCTPSDWSTMPNNPFTATARTTYRFRVCNTLGVCGAEAVYDANIDPYTPEFTVAQTPTADGNGVNTSNVKFTLTQKNANTQTPNSGVRYFYSKDNKATWTEMVGKNTLDIVNNEINDYYFKAVTGANVTYNDPTKYSVHVELVNVTKPVMKMKTASGADYDGTKWTNETVTLKLNQAMPDSSLTTLQYATCAADDVDCTDVKVGANEAAWKGLPADAYSVYTTLAAGNTEKAQKYFFRFKTKGLQVSPVSDGYTVKIDKTAPTAITPTITKKDVGYHVDIAAIAPEHGDDTPSAFYQLLSSKSDALGTWISAPNGGFDIVLDGTYFVAIQSKDEAGNTTVSYSNKIVVDNNDPVITVAPNMDETYLGKQINISDAGSGLNSVTINGKTAAFDTVNLTYSSYFSKPGTYVIEAKDASGRITTTQPIVIKGLPSIGDVKNTPAFGAILDDIETELRLNPDVHASQTGDVQALRTEYDRLRNKTHTMKEIGVKDENNLYWIKVTSNNPSGFNISTEITPAAGFTPTFTKYKLYKRDNTNMFVQVAEDTMIDYKINIHKNADQSEAGVYRLDVEESDGSILVSNVFEVVIDKKAQTNFNDQLLKLPYVASGVGNVIDLSTILSNAVGPVTLEAGPTDGIIENVDTANPATDISEWRILKSGTTTLTLKAAGDNTYAEKTIVLTIAVQKQTSTLAFDELNPRLQVSYGDSAFTAIASSTNSNGTVTYNSDDENILKVDAFGNVSIIGVGTTKINATLIENSNFTTETVSRTFTVLPKVIHVKPIDATMVAGSNLPTFALQPVTEFINGATISAFGTPEFSTTATSASSVGTYPISITGFDASTRDESIAKNYKLDISGTANLTIKGRAGNLATDVITTPNYDLTTSPWTNQKIEFTPQTPFTKMSINNSSTDVTTFTADLIGKTTYKVAFKNDANLVTMPVDAVVKYDPTAPDVTGITVANGATNDTRKLTIAAKDQTGLSGMASIRVVVEKVNVSGEAEDLISDTTNPVTFNNVTNIDEVVVNTATLVDGNYRITAYAVDIAGNTSAAKTSPFVVETQKGYAPKVTVSPIGSYLQGTATITVEEDPTDPVLSGVDHFTYTIDGTAPSNPKLVPTNGKATLDVTSDGIYEFKIVSKAEQQAATEAGTTPTGGNGASVTLTFDNKTPLMKIVDTKTADSHTFTFSNTEAGQLGNTTYYWRKGSGAYQPVVGNTITFINESENGQYQFKAKSDAGIESTSADTFTGKQYTVNIETVGFENLNVTSTTNAWTNQPVDFEITGGLSDMSKLSEYQYCAVAINETLNDCSNWNAVTMHLDASNVVEKGTYKVSSDGQYQFFFKAVTKNYYDDPAKIAGPFEVKIDTIDPNPATISAPTEISAGSYTYHVDITAPAPDHPGETMYVEYQLLSSRSSTLGPWQQVPANGINLKQDGTYVIAARSMDEAGNTTISYSRPILVDTQDPTVKVEPTVASSASTYLGRKVTIDDHGIDLASITINNASVSYTSGVYSAYIKDAGTYTIVAKDKVGRITTVSFTIQGLPSLAEVKNTTAFGDLLDDIESEYAKNPTIHASQKPDIDALRAEYTRLSTKSHSMSVIGTPSEDGTGRYYLKVESGNAAGYKIESTITPAVGFTPVFTSYELWKQDTATGVFQKELTGPMNTNVVSIKRSANLTEKGIYRLDIIESDGTITKSNEFEVVVDKKNQINLKGENIVVTYDAAGIIDLTNALSKAIDPSAVTFDAANSILNGVLATDATDIKKFTMQKSGTAILVFHAPGNDVYKDKTVTFNVTINPQMSQIAFKDPAATLIHTYGDPKFSAQAESTQRPTAPITYESSDEDVLTVDANGEVTIIGAGTANITATLNSDASYDSASIVNTYTINPKKLTIIPDVAEMFAGDAIPTPTIKDAQGLLAVDAITDFGDPVFRMLDIYGNVVTTSTPEGTAKIYFDHFVDGVNTANPAVTKNYVIDKSISNTLTIKKRIANPSVDVTLNPTYDLATSPWTNEVITMTPNAPYTLMQINNSGVDIATYAANQIGNKNYRLVLKTADNLTTSPVMVNIKYDPTAPTIMSKTITNGTNDNDRKMKIVAADQAGLSGLDKIRVILNIVDANNVITDHNVQTVEAAVVEDAVTGEFYIEADFNGLDDARYMAAISVTDIAGNRSAEDKTSYFVVEKDNNSMPLVEVTPDKAYLTGTATVTLSEDPNYPVLSGIHHYLYSTDNWTTSTKINSVNGKGTLAVTTDGTYEFKIVSNEEYKLTGEASSGGNAATKTLHFDNAVPKLNVVETKTASTHTFTLSNTETNASPVTYYMKKDSGAFTAITGNTVSITNSADNGKYQFKAVNSAGVESVSADNMTGKQFKVNIETAVFNNINVTPAGTSWTNQTPVTLTLTSGLDDMSKLQEYKYCVVSITEAASDCTADKWMSITPNKDILGNFLDAKISNATEGTYRYFFKAITVSGFEDSTKIAGPYDVLIDTTDPAGIVTKPNAVQIDNGYTAEVEALTPEHNAITAEYKVLPYGMSYHDAASPAAKDIPNDNFIKVTGVRGSRYQLGYLVTDEAGNETVTYSTEIYTIPLKDSKKPEIKLNPKPTNVDKKSYLPIHVNIVDYDDEGQVTSGVVITDELNGVTNPITSPYVALSKGVHIITAKDIKGNISTETFEVLGIPNVNDVRPTPEYEEIINEMKKELGEAKDGVADLYKPLVQAVEDRYNALKNKKNTYTAQISNDPLYVGGSVKMQATIDNDVNFPNTLYTYELYEKQSSGAYKKIATLDNSNSTIVTTPGVGGTATKTVIDYTIMDNAPIDGTMNYKLSIKDKDTDLVEDVQFNATILPKLIGHELQPLTDMNVKVERPMNLSVTVKLDPDKLTDTFNINLYQAADGIGTPTLITNVFKAGAPFTDTNGNTYVTYVTDPLATMAKAEYNGKDFYVKVSNVSKTYAATSSNFKIFVDLKKQDQLVAGYRELKVGDSLTVDHTLIQGILGSNMKVEFTPVNGLKDEETGAVILNETSPGTGNYTAVSAGEAVFNVTIKDQNVPATYEDATTTLTIRVVKEGDYPFSIKTLAPSTYGDSGDVTLQLNDTLPNGAGKVEFAVTDDSRKDVVTITNDPVNHTATMKVKNAGTVKIVARQTGSATLEDRESQPIEFIVNKATLFIKAKDIDITNIVDFDKMEVDLVNTSGLVNGDLISDLGVPKFKTDAAEHNYAIRAYDIKFDYFKNPTSKADNYKVEDKIPYAKANVLGAMAGIDDFATDPEDAKTGAWKNQDIELIAKNGYSAIKVQTPDGEGTFAPRVPLSAARNEGKVEAMIQLKNPNGLKTQNVPWNFYFDVQAPHINSVTYSYTTDGSPISNIIANATNIYNKVLYVNVETDDINPAVNETSGVNNAVLNFIKVDHIGSDSDFRNYDSVSTLNGVTTYQFRLEDSANYTIWPTVTDNAGNSAVGARETFTLDAKVPAPPNVDFFSNSKARVRTSADYTATNSGNEYISDTTTVKLSGNGGALGVDHYEYCRVDATKQCVEKDGGNEKWQIVDATNAVVLPNKVLEEGLGLAMDGALNYKFRIVNTAMVPGLPAYKTIYRDSVKPELEVSATADGVAYPADGSVTTDKDVIFSIKQKTGSANNVSGVTYEYYTDKDSTRRAIIDISNGSHILRVSESQKTTFYIVAVSGAKVVSDPIEWKVDIARSSALDFTIDKAYFETSASDIYTQGNWTNGKSNIYLQLTANDSNIITNGGYYEYSTGSAIASDDNWVRFDSNKLNVSMMHEGSNYFYIRLHDNGSAFGNAQSFQVRIDKTNPGVNYKANPTPDADHATSYDVELTAKDEIAGYSTGDVKLYYTIKENPVSSGVTITYGSPVNNTASFSVPGNNQYRYLYYKACDVAGNCTADTMKQLKFGSPELATPDKDINIGGDLINQTPNKDGVGNPYLNIDNDGDGKPDVNIDVTQDGIPDINLAIITSWNPDKTVTVGGVTYKYDSTIKPTINVTTKKPYAIAETNIDTNGDMQPDINVVWTNDDGKKVVYNQVKMHVWMPKKVHEFNGFKYLSYDATLKAEVNKDTSGDKYPDTDIDTNGDFVPEFNRDMDKDGYPDLNIDTNGDGKADINIDLDGDGMPNKNITVVDASNWTPDILGTSAKGFLYRTTSTLTATLPDVPVTPTDPDPDPTPDPDPEDPGNNGGNNGNNNGNNNGGNNNGGGGGGYIYIPTPVTPGPNGTVSAGDPSGNGTTTAGGTVTTGGNAANGNGNGTCGNLNIDTNKDGIPDINIDVDGDGVADYNIDTNCDGKADKNILSKASVLGLYQTHGSASQGDDIFRFALVALATVLLLLLLIFLKKQRENNDDEFEEFIDEGADL